MATKTLAMTMKLMRGAGFEIEKVEQWVPNPKVPGGGRRRDLFGFADAIAIPVRDDVHPSLYHITAVQACGSDILAHMRKMDKEPMVAKWLPHGGVLLVAWRRVKLKRGGKAIRWKPRIFKAYAGHLNPLDWDELSPTMFGV